MGFAAYRERFYFKAVSSFPANVGDSRRRQRWRWGRQGNGTCLATISRIIDGRRVCQWAVFFCHTLFLSRSTSQRFSGDYWKSSSRTLLRIKPGPSSPPGFDFQARRKKKKITDKHLASREARVLLTPLRSMNPCFKTSDYAIYKYIE